MKMEIWGVIAGTIASILISVATAAQPSFDVVILLPEAAIPGKPTIELGSGWPLVVRATSSSAAPIYRLVDDDIAVVTSGANVCFDNTDVLINPNCLEISPNVIYTRFGVDVDEPGRVDTIGNEKIRAQLVDSSGSGLPVGPATGGEVLDGIGFGLNDDWPGLVLLSNRGVGIKMDATFNQTPTTARRNLAGLLTWSAFEQSVGKGRIAVSAGIIVPRGMMGPVAQIDGAVGPPDANGAYSAPMKYRADGGGIQEGPGPGCPEGLYPYIAYANEVELRAFLVRGTAPSVLVDGDGDGDVDSLDAELAGYSVISSEAVTRFRLWDEHFGYYLILSADLDGNGVVLDPERCGGPPPDIGPGRLRPPPR